MRVLVLTNMYPTESNVYSGIFVRDQVEALRAIGLEIDVLHINNADKLNYFRAIPRLWRKIRDERYDLIHAHYVHSGWIARMQTRLPVIVTSHGSDTMGHEGWFLKRLYPLVDALTITSKQNQDRIGLHETYLLPCGVDTEVFKPQDIRRARSLVGWDLDRKVMLYVGRDSAPKRLDIIKQAHAVVESQRSDVDLFLATAVNHEDIPAYMNAADVFVFASETEGAPVVIKEAMACNLPVVSVDVGDVREVIASSEGCFICDRNAESMAVHVLRVIERGERSNGRETAIQYSSTAIAHKILSIYESVLSKRNTEG